MSQHHSGGATDLVITCIKGEGKFLKFWALRNIGLDTVKNFESRLGSLKQELDSSPGFTRSEQIPLNFKCVVKSKIKQNRWCRAGVLQHQGLSAILVRLLDYGNDEVVLVSDVRKIDDPIMPVQPQAIECILADVMPVHNEWSIEAIKFCEQHLLYNTLSCFVLSNYMKLPVVRVAKKGESEAFVQRLINGGLALIKKESASSPPPASLSYKINTLDPNSNHLVKISCIENAHKFYVQLSAAEMELKHLMDSINKLPKDSYNPLKVPAINTPCLAQLTGTNNYYRALITCIQQSQCKVFFVDYGFSEQKDIHELRAIPTTFLNLVAQAICCSLPRDSTFDPEEIKRLIGRAHVELLVLNRTSEAYIVKLHCRDQDILMPSHTIQNYIPQKLNIGAKCEVIVSYVNDISEFYCQLIQFKDQQTLISNILNTGYNFSPIFLNECTPGKPVCAKFSDDNLWYRARIIKVNHESDIEVFFVDFGNYDNLNLGSLRKIGPDLLKFPVQAFRCFLHETPLPTDSKAQDDAFDLLEELTSDQNLRAHINTFSGDAGYGITLYMENSQLSVNEKLLLKFMSIPDAPVDEIEDVYITMFDSCRSFFAQFEKIDSDKLTNMQDEINTFYSRAQNNSFVPEEGSLVCARFHEDDLFYRAKIEKCNDGHCDVFFIDYGNRESIPIRDVHSIDLRFIQYPQFGTECAFDNFPSQVPNDKLSEVMLENSFKLKMIKKEGDKWYVSLVENCPANASVLKLIKESEAPKVSVRHGDKIGNYREKQFSSQTAHFDSWNDNAHKTSHPANKTSHPANKTSHPAKKTEIVNIYNSEPSKKESFKSSEPVQEFEDYSLISIPPKACRNIYISHIVNPGEFYCQIEEDSAKLQLLMKNIEDTYSPGTDNLSLLNFSIDTPCCAMYNDGAWYRGKIKKVTIDACDIFFVDYGNTDSVPKSKIKKLKNDLFRWPSQAVCCKAFNLSPKFKDWNDDEINAFIDNALDKSFIAQFVECDSNNCYAINLFSIGKLENNIFNKEFVSLGFGRLEDTNKSIILNPHAASTNLSFNAPDIQVGCSESVQVFYGLNPGEIFCQLKSYEQEFKQMMINMQNYYKNVTEAESLIDRPHQGMICAAQFSLDCAWYRAEIKKVEANKIIVFYVDYGNSEKVNRKQIRCIIQEYTILPVQAIKCRIRGIKPPGKTWTVSNNLGKYFEGETACKFISKEEDSYYVDIICNQRDVAQSLISDGLAVLDNFIVQTKDEYPQRVQTETPKLYEKETPKVDESRIKQHIRERKDDFTQGQLLSVTVTFIENPLKFWCQLLDESVILNELIEKIENEIIKYPLVSPSSLSIGSYCMAQYSEDEAWYRAQIKSCESENVYKVFFIDYGNSEIVSLQQMKVMTPDLKKSPPFCFECCLYNAPSKLLPEMTTLFRDTIDDVDEITAKIENVHSGICTMTLLFDKDDQEMNVNELLFGVKENIVESDMSNESPQFLPPDVPLGLHDGYVSVVKSPQDFYIQLAGTEDSLAYLLEELAESSECSANVNPGNLCPGYACSTKYSDDNNWYRAEIIDIQDSTVSVLFVDYGNIETVEKSTLKCLSEKQLQMPSQAIKCKLNRIVPVAEEWTEEAIKTFQDMVLDECLGITFISKDIPATVNIIKDDKEVAQCLVDMELANFESCTETDEAYAEDHLAPAPIEDPLSSLPNDQSYPERKLSSLKHIVKICYVDSYDKFYITPLELGTELDTVSATLEILYDSPDDTKDEDSKSTITDVLEEPKISMPCVSKYNEDQRWYRAIITEIEEENIFVKFIDYGNSEISKLANLRPLPPELLKIPPIALECSLFGIVAKLGKEQEITTKLEEYFLDEMELEVEIIEFSPYKIKLFLNGEDVASSLIREGLADDQCIITGESRTFVDSSKMTFVDESLEYRVQISKRFFSGADKIIGNVKFCEIENDLIVFHVVSTDLENDLQDLQQKLQDAYCEPSQNLTNISCMDFCATKYMEDGNWYRAQILSVEKDKIKVRFIDYGNCETVDKSDIYDLLGDFTIEPQFSVKCILFGLKVDKSKEVELQNKLDECVYHESVELKLCKHSHAVCDLCITSVICSNTDVTELISDEKLVHPQYIINSHLDSIFKATVQKIENDTVFLLPLSVIDEREAFQCKLQNLCKDLEKLTEIQTDHLCAAKVDDTWYRVSVINICESEVSVYLVDFGLIKVTKIFEFVPLSLDICHHPVFLQPCVVHVTEDSTGNVKSISTEDLSVGCEVSCALQKVYPLVQPLSIKIIEIHSCLGEIETKSENLTEHDIVNEINIENDNTIKDLQSFTDKIEVSGVEPIVISEVNVENQIRKDEISIENQIEKNELDEINIENEIVKNEINIENQIEIGELDEISVENEIEKNKLEEINIEIDTTVNDSESFTNDIKISEGEPAFDSKTEVYFSDEENVYEETSIKDNIHSEILSETVSDKSRNDEENESYHKENTKEYCDESLEGNEENTEIDNCKNNEQGLSLSGHELCKDLYRTSNEEANSHNIEDEMKLLNENSDEYSETITDSNIIEMDKNIVDEAEYNETSFAVENEGNTSFEKNEDEKKISVDTSNVLEDIYIIQKSTSETNLIKQQNEMKTFDSDVHITSDDSIHNIKDSSSELLSSMKEKTSTDTESNNLFDKSDKKFDDEYDAQCRNSLNSSKIESAHFEKTFPDEDKCNDLDSEASQNNLNNQDKSFCEFEIDNQNNVDDPVAVELQETSNSSYYYTENKDLNERNVINSFEDTEQKENNRAIEDPYQLTGLVPVKVSHIAISDGSVIFAVQPLYLQEDFLHLKESIQEFYSSKAIPYDANYNSNYCVVYHEGEWCRGKILQSGVSTILLIDYGKCTSDDSSDIKKLDNEHSNVPPYAVWCTFSSVICPPEKNETAITFLTDKLKDIDVVVKILEGGEPYKINMYINGESVLNQLLKNSLVIQKLPNMYLEPESHKAKLSFLNITLGTVQIFVNLSSFSDDFNTLFEDMQKTYNVDDFVSNIVESGIYAVYYNDSWYRGLVVSSGNEVQVYLVDTGETVIGCKNLCFLLPEHCLQPAFAIPCHIPFSYFQATDEIFESINQVLKAAEFLVNIKLCPDTNSLSATLIDEQIMSEVKNIGLTCVPADSKSTGGETKDSVDINISAMNDTEVSCMASSSAAGDVQKHDTSDSVDTKSPCTDSSETITNIQKPEEQFIGYLEETFTAEPKAD